MAVERRVGAKIRKKYEKQLVKEIKKEDKRFIADINEMCRFCELSQNT